MAHLLDTYGPSTIEREFTARLRALMANAPSTVDLTSGKRSIAHQAELWEKALKKYGSPEAARKWVAPPGRSNHNHGISADLKYASADVRRWVHQNAARFGLHFPLGHEPWHIEVLGEGGRRLTWKDFQNPTQVQLSAAPAAGRSQPITLSTVGMDPAEMQRAGHDFSDNHDHSGSEEAGAASEQQLQQTMAFLADASRNEALSEQLGGMAGILDAARTTISAATPESTKDRQLEGANDLIAAFQRLRPDVGVADLVAGTALAATHDPMLQSGETFAQAAKPDVTASAVGGIEAAPEPIDQASLEVLTNQGAPMALMSFPGNTPLSQAPVPGGGTLGDYLGTIKGAVQSGVQTPDGKGNDRDTGVQGQPVDPVETLTAPVAEAGPGGFDPTTSAALNQLNFDTATRTADMQLRRSRLLQDLPLVAGRFNRRIQRQAELSTAGLANRGFAGRRNINPGFGGGVVGRAIRPTAEAAGDFLLQSGRELSDIERAIAILTAGNVTEGARQIGLGANRMSEEARGVLGEAGRIIGAR